MGRADDTARPSGPSAPGRVGPCPSSAARRLFRPQRVAGRRHVRPVPGRSRLGQRQLAGVLRRLPARPGARSPAPGHDRLRRCPPPPPPRPRHRPGSARQARRPWCCGARPPASPPTWRPAWASRRPPACARCRPSCSRSTGRSSTTTWPAPRAPRSASPISSATPWCGRCTTCPPSTPPSSTTPTERARPAWSATTTSVSDWPSTWRRATAPGPCWCRASRTPTPSTSGPSWWPTRTWSARSTPTRSPPTTSPGPRSRSPTRARSAPCSRCPGSCRDRAPSSAWARSATRPGSRRPTPACWPSSGWARW